MTMTTTPIVPPSEMDLILDDLSTTGRSCAADRAIRLAYAALDARQVAFAEEQRLARELRKLATATRQQAKREAEAEARRRFWAARS